MMESMYGVVVADADFQQWQAKRFTVSMRPERVTVFAEVLETVQMRFTRVFVTGDPVITFRRDTDVNGKPVWVAYGRVELTMPADQSYRAVAAWLGAAIGQYTTREDGP